MHLLQKQVTVFTSFTSEASLKKNTKLVIASAWAQKNKLNSKRKQDYFSDPIDSSCFKHKHLLLLFFVIVVVA